MLGYYNTKSAFKRGVKIANIPPFVTYGVTLAVVVPTVLSPLSHATAASS